jgi:hypothetical protein
METEWEQAVDPGQTIQFLNQKVDYTWPDVKTNAIARERSVQKTLNIPIRSDHN